MSSSFIIRTGLTHHTFRSSALPKNTSLSSSATAAGAAESPPGAAVTVRRHDASRVSREATTSLRKSCFNGAVLRTPSAPAALLLDKGLLRPKNPNPRKVFLPGKPADWRDLELGWSRCRRLLLQFTFCVDTPLWRLLGWKRGPGPGPACRAPIPQNL